MNGRVFWTHVVLDGDCWRWAGQKSHYGYGIVTFYNPQRTTSAHRYAYELVNGPIPNLMVLDHLCHSNDPECPGGPTCLHRLCINPAHLEVVSQQVNTLRGRSLPSLNARKTHCVRGHKFSAENTRCWSNGRSVVRMCRSCERERSRDRLRDRKKIA